MGESSSGDKALCVQIKTAPENLIVDQDHPENLIPAIADSEEAAGACTNAGDQQVWTSNGEANFKSDMSACGHSSMGSTGKATSCMKGKEGYSDACATCFGNTIHCTATKCLSKCIGGETAECKQCVDHNCTPDLKACSGLTPPSTSFSTVAIASSQVDEDFVQGGTLKLGWKDCGDSSYHGKVTSLTPSTLTIGANTRVVGSGNVDEEVTAGSFTITSKAMVGPAEHFSGDVCKPKTFKLPLGLATIIWDGLKCPVAKGPADVSVNVKLAASIPAKLARTTIDLKATSSSGHNLICMGMTTAPQQDATIVV